MHRNNNRRRIQQSPRLSPRYTPKSKNNKKVASSMEEIEERKRSADEVPSAEEPDAYESDVEHVPSNVRNEEGTMEDRAEPRNNYQLVDDAIDALLAQQRVPAPPPVQVPSEREERMESLLSVIWEQLTEDKKARDAKLDSILGRIASLEGANAKISSTPLRSPASINGRASLGSGQQSRSGGTPFSEIEARFNVMPRSDSETSQRSQAPMSNARSRPSILDRLADTSDNSSKMVTVMQTQPSFNHIRLEKMTYKSLLHFVENVIQYHCAHDIRLPVPTLVSTPIRNFLLAKNPDLNPKRFYQLSTKELFNLVQTELRPESSLEFGQALSQNVDFELPFHYVPSATNFNTFYGALLIYKNSFTTLFELMAHANEDNIPSCDMKEGGLVRIFIDKIPFEYGSRVMKTIKRSSFEDFRSFLTVFYAEVRKHSSESRQARGITQHFGGTAYTAARQNSNSHAKDVRLHAPAQQRDARNFTRRQGNSQKFTRAHNLHVVEEETPLVDDPLGLHEFSDEDVSDNDPKDSRVLLAAPTGQAFPASEEEDGELEEEDWDQAIDQLAAVAPHKPPPHKGNSRPPDKPMACFKLLFYGKCDAESRGRKCQFSHDRQILSDAWVSHNELLAKSSFKPVPTLLQRQKLNNVQSNVSFDTDDPHAGVIACIRQQALLNAIPESSWFSSMHREGCLIVGENNSILVPKVLFDTGALQSNYISADFVSLHRNALQDFIKSCNTVVKLADNKTTIPIGQCLEIPIRFVDDDNVCHESCLMFCILPTGAGGNDIIIGLPAIISSFANFFGKMVDTAVAQHADSGESLANIESSLDLKDGLRPPWNGPTLLEAPEDLDTPLPVAFGDALHFMEMSHAEAVKEFEDLIPSHVDPAFAAATDIVSLLRTKGVDVFVPRNWEGVSGFAPLKLSWLPGIPEKMKPKARPINPKLYQHAKAEFDRLSKYFYVPSSSPIASCLVIAPKATPPFIRFCGDYVAVNKYLATGHYPIPHVQHSLEKIMKFSVFVDLDMTNSYHQFRLDEEASERLSVQTPWGQFRPVFMPEGIGPASGILQSRVSEIFADFAEWTIVIFDNFLVLATDYADAYRKVELVLDRCKERNLFLKFSKSWLGFPSAKFFGYVCYSGRYQLSEDRKSALQQVPFPKGTKQMQSFLGAALFFKSFIPHYASLVAPLNDMVAKSFDWDESTWKIDYRARFEEVKNALQHSVSLYYPDYSLDWILRTDASLLGVGAVLLQQRVGTDGSVVLEPIELLSAKFSPQASRWSTIEQEAYAIYYAVHKLSYYLRCKAFVLETDHQNLLWMEASSVPKIIRWRIFLQSFSFLVRHIAGKANLVADWLSRAPHLPEVTSEQLAAVRHSSLPTVRMRHPDVSVDSASDSYALSRKDDIAAQPSFPKATESLSAPEIVPAENTNEDFAGAPLLAEDPPAPPVAQLPPEIVDAADVNAILRTVHGGRMGHHGARRTWLLLNQHFPGHTIPFRTVLDFIVSCPVCQKDRLGMINRLQPVVRTLKPPHPRYVVGVDTLTVTPADNAGNCYLIVVVNHYTKFTGLYPSSTKSAEAIASALFRHFCTFGVVDFLLSDPGTEFMNSVVSSLTKWFGVRHQFSLVDRHESNGVERTNGSILRHLRALVFDERVRDRWSSPDVLSLIQYFLNSADNSETGVIPLVAMFGTLDASYITSLGLGEKEMDLSSMPEYVVSLDGQVRALRDISRAHQDAVAQERIDKQSQGHHTFQRGDFVLLERSSTFRDNKLSPKLIGPFEVLSQHKNDVTCRHVAQGNVEVLHLSRLSLFVGSRQEAQAMALLDRDHYVVRQILAYRGDIDMRTTMEFEVEFEDGDIQWLPFSAELFDTIPYENFCRQHSELRFLLVTTKVASDERKRIKSSPIELVVPGDEVFVNLRSYSEQWYAALELPDPFRKQYVLRYSYGKLVGKDKRKIEALCPLFEERFVVDNVFVHLYGSIKALRPDMVLIDEAFCIEFPQVLPEHSKTRLLKKFKTMRC
jgi:hypothetical protein